MRRLTARALPAVLLLLVAGCGDESAPETANVTEVRGAPLFVPAEPPPEPAPEVTEPDAPDAPDTATPDVDAPPDDIAIGDPSAPLSEPPPPETPTPETPTPEPTDQPDAEPGAADPTDAEPADGDAPVSDATTPDETTSDDSSAVVHATATGSADSPVELVFPAPDEKGLIFVTFEQLASFEYLPPGGPNKAVAEGDESKSPDAKIVDEPAATTPAAKPPAKIDSSIPEPIRKLSGKKIEVEGYMIPLRFEDGKVKSFFLSRHLQGCCFGVVPRVNDVIEVEMVADGDAYYDAYMPIIVTGPFEVKEDSADPAYLQTIYFMKAESSRFAEDW